MERDLFLARRYLQLILRKMLNSLVQLIKQSLGLDLESLKVGMTKILQQIKTQPLQSFLTIREDSLASGCDEDLYLLQKEGILEMLDQEKDLTRENQ